LTGGVNVEAWQARHPKYASELARLVPTVGLLADLSSSAAEAASDAPESYCDRTLGDFRILREVGRGGMGIVYEAEQLSLGRRVALKILPTAAVLDPRTLQRFKNEAQAAAALDHPHIVDVYGVGAERGVHYYAMRLIDGCTLADLITDLRVVAGVEVESKVDGRKSKVEVRDGRGDRSQETGDRRHGTGDSGQRDTKAIAGLSTFSTQESLRSQRFVCSVAEVGLRVAEALAHAHDQGIIHRDIKPSNLLLDSQGKVWIADFGLAHIEANPTLTASGDLLGTLRYMSPEQALVNRTPVDHRTDIYSLGATLYELITLQPLFGESDRAALIHKIAFSEPTPPRKLNPRIPADLETILLKMLEKDPGSRYATAGDLADDLRRFAQNQPIQARMADTGAPRNQMGRPSSRRRRRGGTGFASLRGPSGWVPRLAGSRGSRPPRRGRASSNRGTTSSLRA
jgi:serine/threonine-protein kinase